MILVVGTHEIKYKPVVIAKRNAGIGGDAFRNGDTPVRQRSQETFRIRYCLQTASHGQNQLQTLSALQARLTKSS